MGCWVNISPRLLNGRTLTTTLIFPPPPGAICPIPHTPGVRGPLRPGAETRESGGTQVANAATSAAFGVSQAEYSETPLTSCRYVRLCQPSVNGPAGISDWCRESTKTSCTPYCAPLRLLTGGKVARPKGSNFATRNRFLENSAWVVRAQRGEFRGLVEGFERK
jgi:hypothetical protein